MEVPIKAKIKELLRHGIVYGLTASLQNVLGFVLLPIFTVYYTPSEFGIYSILLVTSTVSGAIFYFGASTALGRFYFDEDSEAYRKQLVSNALLITLMGALILFFLVLLFGKYLSIMFFDTDRYYLHLILACTGAAFGFLLTTMTLLLRYEKKSKLFMLVTLAGVCLNFTITYVLLSVFNFGVLAPLYGTMISMGLSFLFLLTKKWSILEFNLKSPYFKLLWVFGLQSSVVGFMFYLLDFIDRIIINDLLTLADVGIYSLGYRIAFVINVLLIMPFSLIWAPMRMQYATNNNNKEFVTQVFSYFTLIGFMLVIMAILFGTELMSLLFTNSDYEGANKVFPIIMLALLFFGFQNVLDFGIYLHKKLYFYIIIAIVAIVFNVLMNYWLIPFWGYIAAAYITLFTYFLSTTLIYFISSRYHKIILDWKRILIPFSLLVLIYYATNFTHILESYSWLKRICFLIILILYVIFIWLNKDEKLSLVKQLNRYK